MLMYSLIAGLLIPEKGQMRSQTDETSPEIPLDFLSNNRLSSKFLGRGINPCLNSSSSSSSLDEDITEVLKYSFYTSYVKLTCDLPLVVCTCSLEVGLLLKNKWDSCKSFIELDKYQIPQV